MTDAEETAVSGEPAPDHAPDPETVEEEPSVSDATVNPDPDAPGGRDVVVPLSLYKRITVFSTLFAVLAVVAGFVLLDSATNRATADLNEVNVLVAVLGVGSIALGAATYAFSTRFRTEGMGNPKDDES